MPTKPTSAKLTKLTKLRPHPDNYRRHSEAQLEQLCASIENAGFYRNIVACKDGTILAGHGAVLAAERLGMTDVPVVFIDAEPTSREALKVLVGDNWISNLAQDDEAALAATLKSLEADDALEGTGFSAEDLEALRDAVAATDAEPVELVQDEVPEAPEEPITKVGDLWILGRHRLLCGDSTKAEDLARLMNGEAAGCVFTDPPYGMSYKGVTFGKDGLANDEDDEWEAVLMGSAALWPDVNAAVCFATSRLDRFFQCVGHLDFCRLLTIYKPNGMAFPWRSWILTSEVIALFQGGSNWPEPSGHVHDVYVHDYSERPESSVNHPTVKPLSIVADIVPKLSAGGIVLDPFLGSGTTLIAAEQLGRACYGMELSPAFCDVIVRRWENLTGGKAKLA